MKKIIIFLAVLMMAGIASAQDPNDLPVGTDMRWEVNGNRIMTINIRLPAKFVKILSMLPDKVIGISIERMMRGWRNSFVTIWQKSRTDEDMGL
ncbi:hypothetical protein LCGC14_1021820 [marine sediment metagenome]|uniref:Uncharacterized protein n=1 Tax=marine sediment metagenome TaxID=412755 RepID=A0A0F9QFB5_9ZZZZ|nr:hypothetical protein [Phycisphaerales bacterium]